MRTKKADIWSRAYAIRPYNGLMFRQIVTNSVTPTLFCLLLLTTACPPPSASCKQDSDCTAPQHCFQSRCTLPVAAEVVFESTESSAEIAAEPRPESPLEPTPEPRTENVQEADAAPENEATSETSQETAPEQPRETTTEPIPESEPIPEPIPEPTPETAPAGSLGTPCQNDAQCTQGRCLAIIGLGQTLCSLPCKQNKDCPTNSLCQRPKAWEGFCMPACQRNLDCTTLYPHTALCASEGHCWSPKRMGVSCLRKDECATGLDCVDPGGIGEKICTQACTEDPTDPRASCGGNFFCEAHMGAGSSGFCVPLCQKSEDCRPFSAMQHCNFEGHCWRSYLNDFRLCTDSTTCLSGLCKQPKDLHTAICTSECTQDSDCPLRTRCSGASPQTTGLCLPSCTSHADCAIYTDLQTCETNGFCR